jgi:hypothetical protein
LPRRLFRNSLIVSGYPFWIPIPHGPQDDLLIYLLPIDRIRAILILSTLIVLIVPFVVIALRYFKAEPLTSIMGVVFGAAFIGFEISHRSIDFFFVGGRWAPQFANAASAVDRDLIVQRFATWNDIAHAWFFPLMLSFLLASCCFAVATWSDRNRGGWYYLHRLLLQSMPCGCLQGF